MVDLRVVMSAPHQIVMRGEPLLLGRRELLTIEGLEMRKALSLDDPVRMACLDVVQPPVGRGDAQ